MRTWYDLPFFESPEWDALSDALEEEQQKHRIFPPMSRVFRALDLCGPDDVRVLMLGQDPYHTPGHANGLAFSTDQPPKGFPPSLRNISKELLEDTGELLVSGNLEPWARQGVLLLNTCLTVRAGEANSHRNLGWAPMIDQMVQYMVRLDRPMAFCCWGKQADDAIALLNPHHLKITSAHPSPLSAHRGFFGSRPFSRINEYLVQHGHPPIVWRTEHVFGNKNR